MLNPHSYEEIRSVVVDLLISANPPNQYVSLENEVAAVFLRKEPPDRNRRVYSTSDAQLNPADYELVRDVFWDLFRQGVITLGWNRSNNEWPFFRLSHSGKNILTSQTPWRFHDTSSYISMVRREVNDIGDGTINYLEESASSFYAGCLLASSVMLGVAAELEFLRLVKVCIASPAHGTRFRPIEEQRTILQKIIKFRNGLSQIINDLPQPVREGLEANFDAIQSLIRIARNDAGHPTASFPDREQIYVYLQLFIPFCRQVKKLRDHFKN